ncbi:MAG TPA: hypothetical protein VMW16_03875 [Sedimentisphaerales bacterium]|nr:hypothetical protein [Sedimentisphaerales bacterium]
MHNLSIPRWVTLLAVSILFCSGCSQFINERVALKEVCLNDAVIVVCPSQARHVKAAERMIAACSESEFTDLRTSATSLL